jgi:Xaa-Pro aminopeptidase
VKSDIERLMAEKGLDALVVLGAAAGNPSLYYVVDGAGLGNAVWLKRRGHEPHLVYNPMERDQARATGIDGSSFPENDWSRFLEEHGGEGPATTAAFLAHLLKKNGASGKVGVYGTGEAARLYPMIRLLGETPGITIHEETNGRSLLEAARITKSEAEVARMKKVALACFDAMDGIKAIIRSGRLRNGRLHDRTGRALTIGDLRAATRRAWAQHGVIEDHDSVVAMGKDGTAPHNRGTDTDALEAGKSIIVDIFPREGGGGYFFDMTRTYCVGAAPPRLREVYSQVKEVLLAALAELSVGTRCINYQLKACERFEAMGYTTIRQDSRVESGYVHGLGHGLGLDIHESPRLGGPSSNPDVLAPGHVVTVEPGLYLPEEGVAVRLEDVVYVRPDGRVENLTTYPYDLEIFPEG